MRIDVFTIFPQLIVNFATESLLGRAQRNGLLDIRAHDLRDGAPDVHRSVDGVPFGGGPGMVLAVEPIFRVVKESEAPRPLLLLSPGGQRFDQAMAVGLASGSEGGFSLLCGRYEGVDQRAIDHLVDREVSIGDVILAGGEVAALVIIEAVSRLLPGVMGNAGSAETESFADHLLEYPQYTRPASFHGWEVPAILQSGNHGAIAKWRRAAALHRTILQRPDLIDERGGLNSAERDLLREYGFNS